MGQTFTQLRWEWAQGRTVNHRFFIEAISDGVRYGLSLLVLGPSAFHTHWQLQRQISGCVSCARVHLPNERYFTCGSCADANHDLCGTCHTQWLEAEQDRLAARSPNNNELPAVPEPATAGTEGAALAAPVHVFHPEVFPLCVSIAPIAAAARCTAEALALSFRAHASRDLLGVRQHRSPPRLGTRPSGTPDAEITFELLPEYSWRSYQTVGAQAAALGTELRRLAGAGGFVGVLGSMSPEWVVTDIACVLKGLPVVLMHRATSSPQLLHILNETNLDVLVASRHLRPTVLSALGCRPDPHHRQIDLHVVWIDDDVEAHPSMGGTAPCSGAALPNAQEHEFAAVVARGAAAPLAERDDVHIAHSDSVVKLLPSSGSTGMPKLIVVTEAALFRSIRAAAQPRVGFTDHLPTVVYAYEVMRQSHDLIVSGGKIGLFSGSLGRMFEDCRLLRPTVFAATPTFWNGLYRDFRARVHERAIAVPPSAPSSVPNAGSRLWNECLLEWQHDCPLGNRVRALVSTGAMLSPEVQKWLLRCFNCQITNGYGTTETGGLCSNGIVNQSAEVRLIDCPELGYLTSDEPFPRGEIVAATSRNGGYFHRSRFDAANGTMHPHCRPEDDTVDPDWITLGGARYFRTGDIGQQTGPGAIRVIDRAKSIFKLAQGVFVSPEAIEAVLRRHRYVEQCFVMGTGLMSAVVAVVVPTAAVAVDVPASASADNRIHCVATALRHECVHAGLKSWEIPQRVVLADAFTEASGLIAAGGGKQCRPALIRKYASCFGEEALGGQGPTTLAAQQGDLGVCTGLAAILHEILDPAVAQQLHACPQDSTVASLGLDSLAIARLVSKIQRRFHVTLTPRELFACRSLQGIERAILGGTAGLRAATLDGITTGLDAEGAVATAIGIIDHALRKVTAVTDHAADQARPECIVLTGATGFLGAFLLEALVKVQPARVICLVRGTDNGHARQRLEHALSSYELLGRTAILDRVDVFAADLETPFLGLGIAQFAALSRQVSAIYHCAATVSSALPMVALREPNVMGTARVYALAACGSSCAMRRRVEFNHVSTLGWLPAGHPEALAPVVNESDLLSKSGYAQSKYVAEHVLLECRRRYDLPSRVFRPGVISGSTVTGAANRVDSVMLMIRGLVREGAVCCGPGSPLPATFNLCPVDTVARAIVQVGEARRSCDTAYHVCAPTEVSLAQLVGWLRDAGCVLEDTGVIPFCARMRQTAEDHPLFPFKSMLSSPRPPLHALVVASAHSVRDSPALLTIQPESARGLCREQLHLTLMFFERNGLLLPSPNSTQPTELK